MAKMFQKFEFPAWSCQIFTIEIKIPENQIRHHFRIHLGNPLCILLLIILESMVKSRTIILITYIWAFQCRYLSSQVTIAVVSLILMKVRAMIDLSAEGRQGRQV